MLFFAEKLSRHPTLRKIRDSMAINFARSTVQAHWDEFRERAEEGGGLPRFVTKEVDDYLACGILEHGGWAPLG